MKSILAPVRDSEGLGVCQYHLCEGRFVPRRRDQVFCCAAHKAAFWNVQRLNALGKPLPTEPVPVAPSTVFNCLRCGKEFNQGRRDKLYCSATCRAAAHAVQVKYDPQNLITKGRPKEFLDDLLETLGVRLETEGGVLIVEAPKGKVWEVNKQKLLYELSGDRKKLVEMIEYGLKDEVPAEPGEGDLDIQV